VGASACDHGRSSYFRGYFQRALIGPTAMATKQWDHVVPFWIKNQYRRVDAFSLNQGSNQPSDGSDRPHHKHSLAGLPLMGKLRLQIGIMRNDALDVALISESL
jgi:hypothetical protein